MYISASSLIEIYTSVYFHVLQGNLRLQIMQDYGRVSILLCCPYIGSVYPRAGRVLLLYRPDVQLRPAGQHLDPGSGGVLGKYCGHCLENQGSSKWEGTKICNYSWGTLTMANITPEFFLMFQTIYINSLMNC